MRKNLRGAAQENSNFDSNHNFSADRALTSAALQKSLLKVSWMLFKAFFVCACTHTHTHEYVIYN